MYHSYWEGFRIPKYVSQISNCIGAPLFQLCNSSVGKMFRKFPNCLRFFNPKLTNSNDRPKKKGYIFFISTKSDKLIGGLKIFTDGNVLVHKIASKNNRTLDTPQFSWSHAWPIFFANPFGEQNLKINKHVDPITFGGEWICWIPSHPPQNTHPITRDPVFFLKRHGVKNGPS